MRSSSSRGLSSTTDYIARECASSARAIRKNTRSCAQGAVKGPCCSRSSCSASRARAVHSCTSWRNRALVTASVAAAALAAHARQTIKLCCAKAGIGADC
jgi:hypothetical protein